MPHDHPRIALLIETSNAYGRGLLRGIHAWSREMGADWSFRLVEQGRGAVAPSWLDGWDGDGVIARVENESIKQALGKLNLPVVDVSAGLQEPAFPRVVTDSAKAVEIAFDHFKSLAFEHFAFCGDNRFYWSVVREKYFAAQLEKSGLQCYIRSARSDRPETEIAQLAEWLVGLPKPVGVLACYDIHGQEVLEACREAGLRVPDEVAVLGVHNDEILCELCDPPLSSVIPNSRAAGFEAAALLNQMIGGKPPESITHLVDPIGVAKRQSTDVVAISDKKISAALRYIQESACEGISVTDVLKVVPMARTQLERQFRKMIGKSPREQIEHVRMERVKEFLSRSSMPISAIAENTGYEYPESLTVAFKRLFGISPREYRSKHRR